MKKAVCKQLITTWKAHVQSLITQVEELQQLPSQTLNWKSHANAWSVLECLEHLNLYGDYYLPTIKKALLSNKAQPEIYFTSGWLGNYFAQRMLPSTNMKTMRTFKDKNPVYSTLPSNVMDRFLHQQQECLELLRMAEYRSLSRIRITVSISYFIRLKLGDTFQFMINHNIRHMQQIDRVWQEAGQAK